MLKAVAAWGDFPLVGVPEEVVASAEEGGVVLDRGHGGVGRGHPDLAVSPS